MFKIELYKYNGTICNTSFTSRFSNWREKWLPQSEKDTHFYPEGGNYTHAPSFLQTAHYYGLTTSRLWATVISMNDYDAWHESRKNAVLQNVGKTSRKYELLYFMWPIKGSKFILTYQRQITFSSDTVNAYPKWFKTRLSDTLKNSVSFSYNNSSFCDPKKDTAQTLWHYTTPTVKDLLKRICDSGT